MSKLGVKGNISNSDLMIQIVNNFPKEHNLILDDLKNHLMSDVPDALTIKVICENLNHLYKK